ncbi:MAG: preprotein translocase subunit SecG [Raineya sp.]|nr:preprotein translocase subunit SecG [Raineya sp.]MDW8297286.1 preprotein translocase subunit SecG [Raineya sp.]
MLGFLVGLMMLLSVLLIVVILPQQSAKSGGGAIGAAAGANQMLGVKKTNDLLEKITWGLMIAIFVLALLTGFFK